MGNDPWWKINIPAGCWDTQEKPGRTSPGKSKLPAEGMNSNGEIGGNDSIPVKFQGIPGFSPNSVMFPSHASRILKNKKRDQMTWRIPKFLLFPSLSKATWPRRDEGSRNSWICLGFAADGAQAREETFQRMNIPVYFLGTAGHGISRSPGKGIESNPEIFGKKQEKSTPVLLQDPASPIPCAGPQDPMEFWHSVPFGMQFS